MRQNCSFREIGMKKFKKMSLRMNLKTTYSLRRPPIWYKLYASELCFREIGIFSEKFKNVIENEFISKTTNAIRISFGTL